MSWRLGLFFIENVLVLSDTDKSVSRFAVGRDVVWSVLMSLHDLERVWGVSLIISSARMDDWILICLRLILSVITDLICKYWI